MEGSPSHLMEVAIAARSKTERQRLRQFLDELSEIDSSVAFKVHGPTGNILLKVMSEPHLQSLIDLIRQDLKITIDVGYPLIQYQKKSLGADVTSIILEPLMRVEVNAPVECRQDILRDLVTRRGRIIDNELNVDAQAIHALMPLSSLFGYVDTLRSLSKNEGICRLQFSHYDPLPLRISSKLGVSFTAGSVVSMRRFAADISPHTHYVLSWGIESGSGGVITIGLGAGPAPKQFSSSEFEDQIDGVWFYWCTRPSDFDLLRTNFCVDYEKGKKTHVIALSKF